MSSRMEIGKTWHPWSSEGGAGRISCQGPFPKKSIVLSCPSALYDPSQKPENLESTNTAIPRVKIILTRMDYNLQVRTGNVRCAVDVRDWSIMRRNDSVRFRAVRKACLDHLISTIDKVGWRILKACKCSDTFNSEINRISLCQMRSSFGCKLRCRISEYKLPVISRKDSKLQWRKREDQQVYYKLKIAILHVESRDIWRKDARKGILSWMKTRRRSILLSWPSSIF